jgi:hypothetical protein
MTDDPIGDPLDSSWVFDSNPFRYIRESSLSGEALEEAAEDESEDLFPAVPNPIKPAGPGALEETWWLLEDERTDMSDIQDQAGTSLDKMFDRYKLYPVEFDQKRRLFIARYEFPQYGKTLQHEDAVISQGDICGFIDFLSGFPMQNCEQLMMFGEWSSREDQITADANKDRAPIPPVPQDFFEGYEEEKRLLNLFYIDSETAVTMADDLKGESAPEGLHWWVRINIPPTSHYPVPGEFLCLGNRQWCTLPWGEQKSNPYLFSGNWMDTVFYTGALIQKIIEEGDYPLYDVVWRRKVYRVAPTDFARYEVGDRVTILKNIPDRKVSQQWKDEDTETFDTAKWIIAPIMFYGIKGLAQETE